MVFLCSSPFQALNCVTYILQFSLTDFTVLVHKDQLSDLEYLQILNIVSPFGITLIELQSFSNKTKSNILHLKYQKVFISDLENFQQLLTCYKLKPNEIVIGSDGTNSFYIQKNSSLFQLKKFSLKIASHFLTSKLLKKTVKQFTIFKSHLYFDNDLPNYEVIPKKIIKNFIKKPSYEYIFIGGPLSESGLLKQADEVDLIISLKNDLQLRKNINLIYISHRRETDNKLEYLREHGVKVVNLYGPIELYFLKYRATIKDLYTFISSASFSGCAIGIKPNQFNFIDISKLALTDEHVKKITIVQAKATELGINLHQIPQEGQNWVENNA
jgi:hypothetical protein